MASRPPPAPRAITDAIGKFSSHREARLGVLLAQGEDAQEMVLPGQVHPSFRGSGDQVARWAAYLQRVFDARVDEWEALHKRPACTRNPLFPRTSGVEEKVRFRLVPAEEERFSSRGLEGSSWRQAEVSTMRRSADYVQNEVSGVFDFPKADPVAVWREASDPRHDDQDGEYLTLRVLSWNLFLVAKTMNVGQKQRGSLFGKYAARLGDFDAVCLSECFDPRSCDRALKSFSEAGYASATKRVNRDRLGGLMQNAGVHVVTKHEIIEEHHLEYSKHWDKARLGSPLNYLVQRGAVVARIRTAEGRIFSLACTHPDYSTHKGSQSLNSGVKGSLSGKDLDELSKETRHRQLRELRRFVDAELGLPDYEPLVFAGDYNVDKQYYAHVTDATTMSSTDAYVNGAHLALSPFRVDLITRLLQEVKEGNETATAMASALSSSRRGTPHLRRTIAAMQVQSPAAYGGAQHTLDATSNGLVFTRKSKYLDYIFVDDSRVPSEPYVQWSTPIKLDEKDAYKPTGFKHAVKRGLKALASVLGASSGPEKKIYDLSDHYPVMAVLRFPTSSLARLENGQPVGIPPDELYAMPLHPRFTFSFLEKISQQFLAASLVDLFPDAIERAQVLAVRETPEPRPVLHPAFRVNAIGKRFFRWSEDDRLYHWIPRDRIGLFADVSEPLGDDLPYVDGVYRTMVYNTFMIDKKHAPLVSDMASKARAELLPKYIGRIGGGKPLDAVCLTECYADELCHDGIIGRTLRDEYGYSSVTSRGDGQTLGGIVQDSGVLIASPHKLVSERHLMYEAKVPKPDCLRTPSNCVINHGAVHAQFVHSETGHEFDVVCTTFAKVEREHSWLRQSADYNRVAAGVRLAQVKELARFATDAVRKLEGNHVLVLANANGDLAESEALHASGMAHHQFASKEFLDALDDIDVLRVPEVDRHGWSFSSDPNDNRLARSLYPFSRPQTTNIVGFLSSSSRKMHACSSLSWIANFKLDEADAYAGANLATWWRALRSQLSLPFKVFFGWARSVDEEEDEHTLQYKYRDLSVAYPMLLRTVFRDPDVVRKAYMDEAMVSSAESKLAPHLRELFDMYKKVSRQGFESKESGAVKRPQQVS